MIRSIPIRTAAASLLIGGLPLAPAFAQAPAGGTQAPGQAQARPTQGAPISAAAPAQPAHPAVAHQPLNAAQRASLRREHHIAHMRTATSELEAALSDMREGRIAGARIALDHAESAVLNEREAALFAGNEEAREQAIGNVLGQVESARFNLQRDRAWSERMVSDALRGLREAPRI